MAYNVGSIDAQLRIDLAQFLNGLKQGETAARQTTATLLKQLQVAPRVDARPLAALSRQVQSIGLHTQQLTQRFSQLRSLLTLLPVALGGVGLSRLAGDFIDTASAFENLETRLISLTGSLEQTQAATRWITRFTADTPLELDQVSKAFVNLTAVGLDATRILPGLIEGLAAFGQTGEGLDRVVYQLTQMIGKNRVLAQDLNVITDTIPAALDIIRDQLKLTDAQLADLAKSGVSAKAVVLALAQGLEARFAGASLAMSRTWTGIVSNIRDTWTQFQKTVMDAGLFDWLKANAEVFRARMVQALQDNTEAAQDWAQATIAGIESIARSVAGLIDTFGQLKRTLAGLVQVPVFSQLSQTIDALVQSAQGVGAVLRGQLSWTEFMGAKNPAELKQLLDTLGASPAAEGTARAFVEQWIAEVRAKLPQFQAGKAAQAARATPVRPATDRPAFDPDAERQALATLRDAWQALQAEHRRALQLQEAQGEVRLAQLAREHAGEETLLATQQAQQLALLATEQTQLRAQAAWLQGQKAIDQEELKDVQARQVLVGLEAQLVRLTSDEALQRARVTRELAESVAMGRLQDALLQRQLDLERDRLEADQLHIRMLDLAPAQEQLLLTLVQAERQERQVLAELERTRQQAAEAALTWQTTLLTAQADQVQALTAEYATQQTTLDNSAATLQRQLELLGLMTQEARELEAMAPFKEAAADLVGVVRDFQAALAAGSLDIARTVRHVGQSFIDLAMRPMFEQMQQALAKLLKSVSDQLGSWGGLVTAGIGVALVAVASAFDDQSAQVESLGQEAARNIESIERTRGLIAGETSIAIQQLSQDLSRAMRPTNALISEGNRILAVIATALGQQTTATSTVGGGGYTIAIETLAGARV